MISDIDEQINREAAAAAQERIDANAGWAFMRQLAAKHFEQGYFAAQIGITFDDAGLYSPDHRRGYAAALAGAVPQYTNVGGLPALSRQ